jgi:polar amino acid transport system permease protein
MDFIRHYYFDTGIMGDSFDVVLKGFWVTIKLSVITGVCSLLWGLALAVLRQLPGTALAPVRWLSIAYIDVFRGIPALLVLLLVSGFLASGVDRPGTEGFLPESIGLPTWFGQPTWFWYGVIGLTLTYGAYMAEVYRAGIEAVPGGQMEAARSLGMSHGQAMRFVVVPQAVSKVIPPLLNDFIALMKDTSLVFAIGGAEVVDAGFDVQSDTFNGSALTLGAIFFLVVTIPLARLVDVLIARQRAKTQRSGRGGGDGGTVVEPAFQPMPSAGGGMGAGM